MRVDSHQHFWRRERGDYTWLTPDLEPIYRDYLPDDLAPQLERAGVTHTILVQAAATVAETRFMLELAAQTPFVRRLPVRIPRAGHGRAGAGSSPRPAASRSRFACAAEQTSGRGRSGIRR